MSDTKFIKNERTIESLYAVRFFAALCVLIAHVHAAVVPVQSGRPAFVSVLEFLPAIGMPLFFVLSGFLIHFIYHPLAEKELNKEKTYFQYFVARFARLVPLYFLALMIFCKTKGFFQGFSFEHAKILSFYITFSQSWFFLKWGDSLLGIMLLSVAWSISTEVFFYIIYPLIAKTINSFNLKKTIIIVVSLIIFAHVVLFLVYLGVLSFLTVNTEPTVFSGSFIRWLCYISPYIKVFDFITGCLMAQVFLKIKKQATKKEKFFSTVFLILAITCIVFVFENMRIDNGFGKHTYFWFLHMNYGLTPFLAFLIFYIARYVQLRKERIVTRAIILLGEASYAMYLIHSFIYELFGRHVLNALDKPHEIKTYLFFTIVPILVTILLSIFIFKFYESPLRRWIRTYTRFPFPVRLIKNLAN